MPPAMRFLPALVLLASLVCAQNEPLDPTRGTAPLKLESAVHQPLPEQFIWIAGTRLLLPAAAESAI